MAAASDDKTNGIKTCFLESKSAYVSKLSLYSSARGAIIFVVICISYRKIKCDCVDVVLCEPVSDAETDCS